MSKQSDINRKVNETLESLEGIQRAEPAPFLYTRLKARMQREEKNIWEITGSFLARPAVSIASLVLILFINAFILINKDAGANPISDNTPTPAVIPVEEYVLSAANSNYDYVNLEP